MKQESDEQGTGWMVEEMGFVMQQGRQIPFSRLALGPNKLPMQTVYQTLLPPPKMQRQGRETDLSYPTNPEGRNA